MKRYLIALACLALAASFAVAETVYLGGNGSTSPVGKVVSDTPSETVINFSLEGFAREKETTAGTTYDRITLSGRAGTSDIGRPEVPALRETIMIPGDRKVRVDIVTWNEVTLSGYELWPFQTPTTDIDAEMPFVRDAAFYAGAATYPAKKVELGTPGIFRDIRVIPLSVYPFRWNPATKELSVATKITVKLTYYGQGEVNTLDNTGYRNAGFEPLYRETVLNYRPGPAPLRGGGNLTHPEILFICYPSFTDEVAPLAAFYNKMGHYTKVVTTNDTGTSRTSIKNYIQTVYDETSPAVLEYVLLVGDINYVAAGRWPGYSFVADYWYNCLTGGQSDPYPDINVGRFSTTSSSSLTHFVNKAIKYQQDPPRSDSWLENDLLVAHKEGAPGKYEGCTEQIRTYNYSKFNPNWTTCYGSQGKRNSDVSNAINAGQNIAGYRGHGSATEWWSWNTYNESYRNSNFHALNNGDKTSIILNVACDNADFDYGAECLVESELNATYGAVAGNGATDPSYTIPNHDYMKEMYKAVYDQAILNCGRVSNYADTKLIQMYGPSSYAMKNVYMYLWNGDPFTKIWMKKPTLTLAGSHPANFTPGMWRPFTVTVTDTGRAPVADALVGLYKQNDIYCAGTTNGSGQVTLYPDPQQGTSGTMYVTATKDGYLGYWGTCQINQTTDINITNFAARRIEEGVRLNWNARSSGELLGFNVYRRELPAESAGGTIGGGPAAAENATSWIKLNDALIVGQGPYSYLDGAGAGEYRYRLEAVTTGDPIYAGPIGVSGKVAPKAFALSQNYPNPARDATNISFSLPISTGSVTLHVYDLSGREIKTFDLGARDAGVVTVPWNLADNSGRQIPAGVYIYRLNTPTFAAAKRLVVAR